MTALIRTNINVQELTVAALMEENREHIYHAAMMDPHTGAELDLDQIWALVDDLIQKTVEPCRKALKDAGVTAGEIGEVVLVGGKIGRAHV